MTDWEKIRNEYITGRIGCKKLSQKHGVSYSSLSKRAAKDGWYKDKRDYINGLISKAAQKDIDKLESLKRAADKMGYVIAKIFEDTEQFKRHIVKTKSRDGHSETWDSEERVFDKYDTKAIKDITASIKDLTVSVRNLYGLLTAPEQSAMDIAAARLLLQQTKAGESCPDGAGSGVVRIAEVMPDDEGGGGRE